MKTNRILIKTLTLAATAWLFSHAAQAGIFTWSAPVAITTADATLNLSGTIVGAEVFGSDEKIVVLSSGATVDFKADNSVAEVTVGSSGATAYGAFTNDTGNANFNAALTQFNYDNGPKTITLKNLVIGQQYSVQLVGADRRDGISASHVANFQDPNDASDKSANFQMGDNVYVIGTFTATANTQDIQENLLNSNGGNINVAVIRAIGTNVPAQFTTQPAAATTYNGFSATFTSAAIGTGTVTYQWQKGNVGGSVFTNLANDARISGATANALTITSLIASDMADYRVIASNSFGSVTSSPAATLTVLSGTPQFVFSAPTPITTADTTLNLPGTIVGAETFGATEVVVTLTNSSTVDFKADGSAAYISAGGFGTANGAFSGNTGNANFNSLLDEFTFDGGPDEITLNNLFVGQQYSVQIFALDDRVGSSTRTANYQDPNDASDLSSTFAMGDNIYTVATFTASNTTVTLQENLLNNNGGNVNAVVIRALGAVIAPQITTQPQPVTIDQGLTATFTISASGSTPLTYHWQKGNVGGNLFTNVVNGGRISGATSLTLAISSLIASDTADYQMVVANAAGSVTSSVATLTVQPTTPQFVWSLPAGISTADATLNQSGTIVGAAVFGPTPVIVILTNGASVDFKNDGSVATATGAGVTTGAFSGNTGNANFNSVLNEFNYDNGPKTITLTNLVAGQQYAVQLFALDDRNGSSSRNANFRDPADAYDYSATFFMPDNVFTIGTFTAAASTVDIQENLFNGGGGNINALVVRRLSGLPLAPQITTQPASVTVTAGATVQLTVGATGTSLTYQWQRSAIGANTFVNVSNGGNVSGANTAQLTFINAAGIYSGDYRLIVSNGSGSVTSSVARFTIHAVTTLTHRWNFNETSGTTAHDSIGAADGTLINGSGTSASFVNGMLFLNNPSPQTTGAGSYVSIPGGLVSSLTAVTFEGWITNSGLNNGNTLIGFGGPIDGSGNGTNFINYFLRWPSSQNGFQIYTTNGNSGVVLLGTRQQNGYFHWVLTYDPSLGNVALYLNGNLLGSASGITVPLNSVATDLGAIGYSLWNQVVGTAIPTTSGNFPYYNGYIDEVRIYDGVLNTNAIAATQLLGADQLLSNSATLTVTYSGGNIVLAWPIVNGGFTPESTPALGANAVWTMVNATRTVAGSNYQMTIPAGSSAAFFRLRQ